MTLLHPHRAHRARQLRWVVPLAALLFAAAAATLLVQYRVSDQAVGTEFFRAHKTVAHTGLLLRHGMIAGLVVLTVLVGATALLALRLTHRIVRPVHTIHRALDALAGGELGVRVELHRADEFREVGDALNRLVDRFAETLARVHAMVDRLDAMSAGRESGGEVHALVHELDATLDFFRLEPRRVLREDGA
jgi:methyl-accepting chemotaxis protein